MIKTVKLHGILAEKFGSSFELDVDSPREAIKAISVQVKGFMEFMTNAHLQGIHFVVYLDDRNIGAKEFCFKTSSSIIRISPIVEGSKSGGVLQIVVGVVMVAAAFYTGGTSIAAWGAAQSVMAGAGAAMLLGGVAQMMIPSVNTADANTDGNKPNYGFGSAVTTAQQGLPVPLLYGYRGIGGFLMSAKQVAKDNV